MASPPFNIAETDPGQNDLIAQFPANEQQNRDIIESWLLAISTNMGELKASALPTDLGAGHEFQDIVLNRTAATGNVELWFRDESDVNQAVIYWDATNDALHLAKYADDGSTAPGVLTFSEAGSLTFNGSTVLRADTAVATAITGTGALNAGSITSGFGSINVGTEAISGGAISGTSGTFAGTLTALQNIQSSTANVVIGTTGAGSVFLRPNGVGSATGQMIVSADGTISAAGNEVPVIASQAVGDIIYRGASTWARLPASTAGRLLQTNGAGAAPSWVPAPSTNVAAEIASMSVGSVGSYAFAGYGPASTAYAEGTTVAGSSLTYAGVVEGAAITGGALTGTWRIMGRTPASVAVKASLWLRIA